MSVCFQFKENGTCKFGEQCRFPHISSSGETVAAGKGGIGDPETLRRGPQLGVDGNWQCEHCTNINFFHRTVCNRCSKKRKDESGNWTCSDCHNLNFPHRDKCNRCGLSKPAGAGGGGGGYPPQFMGGAMGGQMGGGQMGGGQMGGGPLGGAMGGGASIDQCARQFVGCFHSTYDPLESAIQFLMSLRGPGAQGAPPSDPTALATAAAYTGQKRSRFDLGDGSSDAYTSYMSMLQNQQPQQQAFPGVSGYGMQGGGPPPPPMNGGMNGGGAGGFGQMGNAMNGSYNPYGIGPAIGPNPN